MKPDLMICDVGGQFFRVVVVAHQLIVLSKNHGTNSYLVIQLQRFHHRENIDDRAPGVTQGGCAAVRAAAMQYKCVSDSTEVLSTQEFDFKLE